MDDYKYTQTSNRIMHLRSNNNVIELISDSEDEIKSPNNSPKKPIIFTGSPKWLMSYEGSCSGTITVNTEDYKTLKEGEYLNDIIIDLYCAVVQNEQLTENIKNKTYFFSSMFFKKLNSQIKRTESDRAVKKEEIMHDKVKNWTKKVNIFEKDFIVMPICDQYHWFVVILCYIGNNVEDKDKPLILVLDSLGGSHTDIINKIKKYLSIEYAIKTKKESKFKYVPVEFPLVPQQPNSSDCGIYLLQNIQLFFQRYSLLSKQPLPNLQDWFPHSMIKQKREEIANFIQMLAIQQNGNCKINFPSIVSHRRKREEESDDRKNFFCFQTISENESNANASCDVTSNKSSRADMVGNSENASKCVENQSSARKKFFNYFSFKKIKNATEEDESILENDQSKSKSINASQSTKISDNCNKRFKLCYKKKQFNEITLKSRIKKNKINLTKKSDLFDLIPMYCDET